MSNLQLRAPMPLRNDSAVLGRFAWHDLMTTDPDAARPLYTALTGWGTQQWPGSTPPYTMWTVGDAPTAGTMRLPDDAVQHGAKPHWLSYVEVPSVDDTVEKALSLGASTMVPATDIPEVGRFAVLTDPQGAAFAIYTPLADATAPASAKPRVGEFSWHELVVPDHKAAMQFYTTLFGWVPAESVDMGGGMLYQMFGMNGVPLGGMYDIQKDMPQPPHWLPYIHVADAERAATQIKDLGGQVWHGPVDVPGGDRIVIGADAQGAPMAVHASGS